MGNWPSIEYESRAWESSLGSEVSRRVRMMHRGPYESAVTAAISDVDPVISSELSADVADATAALARFDSGEGEVVVDFPAILLRSESASSSKIEKLSATARQIGMAEMGERTGKNAQLIVANTEAMRAALDLSDRLDIEAILTMHETLLRKEWPEIAGKLRSRQVWIGGSDFGPHGADYVAPHHELVKSAIDDLIAFMHRTDVVPLVQVAIAHAQFETIHPFPDGNGRVGRAIVQAMLRYTDVTLNVTVPISAGLLVDVDDYFAALGAYREGEIEPIIRMFVRSARVGVVKGQQLANELRGAREEFGEQLAGLRSDATAIRLADLVFKNPVVNAGFVERELKVSSQAAYNAINALIDRGVIEPSSAGKRNRTWECHAVLDALDRFADEYRRPVGL